MMRLATARLSFSRSSFMWYSDDAAPMTDRDPLDDFAPLIGHAAIQWNNVQFWIYIIFRTLLLGSTSIAHRLFFAVRSDAGQRDLTIALAEAQLSGQPALLKEVRTSIEAVNQMAGKRNDILHAMWSFNPVPDIALPLNHRLRGQDLKGKIIDAVEQFHELEAALIALQERVARAMKAKSSRDVAETFSSALKSFLPPEGREATRSGIDPQRDQRKPRRRRKSPPA